MDWKKLGVFGNLNRIDVWQHVFAFLDIKSVMNHISRSCKSFKLLCLLNVSHIKSICILSLSLDSVSSFNSLIELLKCEKTFLLKVISNCKGSEEVIQNFTNKSVVRLKYKSKNSCFAMLSELIRSLECFSYFTLRGNSSLPEIDSKIVSECVFELASRKINYLKISKITLTVPVFKCIKRYIKEKTPMVIILDVNCFYEKANNFQHYLAEIWKKKWLLNIDYKLNGKILFSCAREFLANN